MRLSARQLSKVEINEIVQKKVGWIVNATHPQRVILFGSAATGEMTDASDIDLILIYEEGSDLKALNRDLARNQPPDDWPHDLLIYTESLYAASVAKGGGACWIADREGKIVYERSEK